MALKELVLFRHAAKNHWAGDPDLSTQGHQQAQKLVEFVRQKGLPLPQQLFSSPRKRAQQTFAPLHQELQIPLWTEPSLDERTDQETGNDFENRVRRFLIHELPQKSIECVYLCTHYDWLEVFSWAAPLKKSLSPQESRWAPCHFLHFNLESENTTMPDLWSLIRYGDIL